MATIKRIDHVAIVVEDINTALPFWRDVLGLPLSHVEDMPEQRSKIAFMPLGGSEIELVQPTDDDSGVARYLAKRGPGMHHVALEVDDLDEKLAELQALGIELINAAPVVAAGGNRAVFIHPRAANGVLVELYEKLNG